MFREQICLIARTSPASWGITAFSTWSLSTLRRIRRRNARARPKTGFGTGSPIRSRTDYPTEVA